MVGTNGEWMGTGRGKTEERVQEEEGTKRGRVYVMRANIDTSSGSRLESLFFVGHSRRIWYFEAFLSCPVRSDNHTGSGGVVGRTSVEYRIF